MQQRHAVLAQSGGQRSGAGVHALGDPEQPVRPVVGPVEACDHGQEDLRGADVARGPLAPDVLLTGLQRQPVGGPARGVDRDAHEASRQLALEPGAHCHDPGVRPTESHRDTEALGRTHHDVRAALPGRGQQAQAEQVRGDHQARAQRMHLLGQGSQLCRVAHQAGRGRHRDQDPEAALRGQSRGDVPDVEDDPERVRARLQDGQGLRMRVGVHHEAHRTGPIDPVQQGHRLGRRGRLVEHGRIGQGKAGQVGDHGLEVQERLEPTLGDLGLVGRVGGVPPRGLQHVAPDHRRGDRVVVAQADHRDGLGVRLRHPAQCCGCLGFTERGRKVQPVPPGDGGRDGCPRQRLEVLMADGPQHQGHVPVIRADVAVGELNVTGWDLHAPTIVASAGLRREGPAPVTRLAAGTGAPVRRRPVRRGRAGPGQPVWRLRRRSESSSPVTAAAPTPRSAGSADRVPSTSRHTLPTAMPKTPWPPRTRSMTSSSLVHS